MSVVRRLRHLLTAPARLSRRPPARLRAEPLEDRSVPSTFMVLNLDDAGPGSLRQAVLGANAAPGADVITFAPSAHGTLALTGGELRITDDLTVSGPGTDRLTVTGSRASRVFHVAGSQVAVSDLTVADGLATGKQALGGGLLNTGGRVSLTAVTFAGNEARGEGQTGAVAGGGAVANVFGATLTAAGCVFTGNRSSAPHIAHAGGVLNDAGSDLTVVGSVFTDNRTGGGRAYNGGGAAAVLGDSTARFTGYAFTANSARGRDGDVGKDGSEAEGGAIDADVSLLVPNVAGSVLAIEQCLLAGNEARGGRGGDASNGSAAGSGGFGIGGAAATWAGSVVTITGTEFRGNRAVGGDGGGNAGRGPGGNGTNGASGALGNANARVTVTRSRFVDNLAQGGSGGSGLAAGGTGGHARGGVTHTVDFSELRSIPGVHAVSTFVDVSATGNRAVGGTGGDGGTGRGGDAGHARGGALSMGSGTTVVRGSTVDGNSATGGAGGTGATRGNGKEARGGGISVDLLVGTLTVSDSRVTDNRATGGAGGVGGFGQGGGIFVGGPANGHTSAVVSGTIVQGNAATGGAGAVRGGDGLGGGVAVGDAATVTLLGCRVIGNLAAGGPGPTAGRGLGGGVFVAAGGTAYADTLTEITGNDASTDDDVHGDLRLL